MRRTAPTLPISPQLLKHFAIATLVLTGLIAMFASGEEWGAQAQLKAVDAKNKLIRTETEKLGTRKLANVLKISNAPHRSFADEDTGPITAVTMEAAGPALQCRPPRRSAVT